MRSRPTLSPHVSLPWGSAALGWSQIEALRTEVTLAVERSESRSAEQRANWTVREATLTEQLVHVKQELQEAKVRSWCGKGE